MPLETLRLLRGGLAGCGRAVLGSLRDLLPILVVITVFRLFVFRLLERFGVMRAPVVENRTVIGVVSFHDLVLRGMRTAT